MFVKCHKVMNFILRILIIFVCIQFKLMKSKSEQRGILFTGAIANRGKRISNANVEDNLLEHLKN